MSHVHIPWYSSLFRADQLGEGLKKISPIALRYGASSHHVYRSRDDRSSYLQVLEFDNKVDFERYWNGPEFELWRSEYSSYYHLLIAYTWFDSISGGQTEFRSVHIG